MVGSKPGVEGVPATRVGTRVSVMAGDGLLIPSSASVIESPPKTSTSEIAAKRKPIPSCRIFCISPPYDSVVTLDAETGKMTLKVAPIPSSEFTQIRPFCASVSVLAIERPTPVSPTP